MDELNESTPTPTLFVLFVMVLLVPFWLELVLITAFCLVFCLDSSCL